MKESFKIISWLSQHCPWTIKYLFFTDFLKSEEDPQKNTNFLTILLQEEIYIAN